jgi:hypothetical protein
VRVYTVHIRRYAPAAGRDVLLVKEGFCWPAFFIGVIWALAHRMWLTALIFLAAVVAVELVDGALGLDGWSGGALSLAVALLIGWSANDLRRGALARRGYETIGIVAASSEDAALRRWFDLNPAAAASAP